MTILSGERSCYLHAVTGHHSGAADCRPDRGLGEPPRKDQQPAVLLGLTPLVVLASTKEARWVKASALLVFEAGFALGRSFAKNPPKEAARLLRRSLTAG
jgi:hypothetical protein